jgi:hypothetical protein
VRTGGPRDHVRPRVLIGREAFSNAASARASIVGLTFDMRGGRKQAKPYCDVPSMEGLGDCGDTAESMNFQVSAPSNRRT